MGGREKQCPTLYCQLDHISCNPTRIFYISGKSESSKQILSERPVRKTPGAQAQPCRWLGLGNGATAALPCSSCWVCPCSLVLSPPKYTRTSAVCNHTVRHLTQPWSSHASIPSLLSGDFDPLSFCYQWLHSLAQHKPKCDKSHSDTRFNSCGHTWDRLHSPQ